MLQCLVLPTVEGEHCLDWCDRVMSDHINFIHALTFVKLFRSYSLRPII